MTVYVHRTSANKYRSNKGIINAFSKVSALVLFLIITYSLILMVDQLDHLYDDIASIKIEIGQLRAEMDYITIGKKN